MPNDHLKAPVEPHSSARCALLVMSCDAYSDLWTPCFTLLERHWPDCPFPLFLGTDTEAHPERRATTLCSPAGSRNWTGRLDDYLSQLEREYEHVLIILDDFFFRAEVPTIQVLQCLRFAQERHAIMVRLIPRPKPTRLIQGERLIGESEPDSPYRLSTQAAIWNIASFRRLLRPNESIWEFEHQGNVRANLHPSGFYATWHPVLPYEGFWAHHVVEKGAWFSHEKYIFARQGIGCDFSRRKTLPMRQVLVYHAAQLLEWSLSGLPWRKKRAVKRSLKRLLRPLLDKRLHKLSGRDVPPTR